MRANWSEMVESVAQLFGMTAEEAEALSHNPVARLVGEMPFLAHAEQAERTAYAHLATFVTAARAPAVFGHMAGESLAARLHSVSNFVGGDRAIIARGMHTLELASLADHAADATVDAVSGKYNPLNSGDVDYSAEVHRLTATIEQTPCAEMDEILSSADAIRLDFWWSKPESVVADGSPVTAEALATG